MNCHKSRYEFEQKMPIPLPPEAIFHNCFVQTITTTTTLPSVKKAEYFLEVFTNSVNHLVACDVNNPFFSFTYLET